MKEKNMRKKLSEDELMEVNGGADFKETYSDTTDTDISGKGPAGAEKKTIKEYKEYIITPDVGQFK